MCHCANPRHPATGSLNCPTDKHTHTAVADDLGAQNLGSFQDGLITVSSLVSQLQRGGWLSGESGKRISASVKDI